MDKFFCTDIWILDTISVPIFGFWIKKILCRYLIEFSAAPPPLPPRLSQRYPILHIGVWKMLEGQQTHVFLTSCIKVSKVKMSDPPPVLLLTFMELPFVTPLPPIDVICGCVENCRGAADCCISYCIKLSKVKISDAPLFCC